MTVSDYLIDHQGKDWSGLLSPFHWLLPSEFTLWLVNRFGDLFIVVNDGSVHLVDVGIGTVEPVASNRDEFPDRIDEENNAHQWLMIPLVDQCVASGLTLTTNDCYGYRTPPVLGGDYTIENTVVKSLHDHYRFLGFLHQELADLPDGTTVRLKLGP